MYAASRKYNVNIGTINAAYQTLSPVASTVISVLWGAYLLRTGETDISSFLAFSMYIVSINMTFLVVATVWVFMKDFAGRANRVARLLEAPTETAGKKNKGIVDVPTGDIQIRNLTFRYPSIEKPVIDNIGFTIPQGKMTAIVGPSGSGKTTFIKLLERLYAPTEGTITIGGTDIQTLNLESWRRSLSYVVQDAGVFSGTLRQALCYSVDREVTEEELTQVTKTVGLYEYIQTLPDGLDTQLANWGTSLSGGQRQRIAIARAMLRDSDVYIFDEPTSALDPETATAIARIIAEGFTGKTVIVISQELNFISQAENIVVLDQGKLAGEGCHSELMAACPVYSDLVQEQSYREVFSV